MLKTCKVCGATKDRSDFPSSGWQTRADGTKRQAFKPECKLCFNAKAKDQMASYFARAGIEMRCAKCGYDRCVDALDLHHTDPSEKEFHISGRWSISYERFLTEISKCVVLCSNCHREHHAGYLGD